METVRLEPTTVSEKVDIVWNHSDKTVKIVQVKSSQNEITYSKGAAWTRDLKKSQIVDRSNRQFRNILEHTLKILVYFT